MALSIDWLNAVTLKSIHKSTIEDLVFRTAELLGRMRRNRFEAYEGGVSMDEAVVYDAMAAGPYSVGEPLNTDVVKPLAGISFTPRQYSVSIADYMENLAINRGAPAVFNALRALHEVAVNSLNTVFNVDLWRHGQNVTTNSVNDNRLKRTNGLEEALNDGVTMSWTGQIFTSYGGQTRNDGNFSTGWNSVPYFCGNSTTGVAGQLTYDKMLDMYIRASQGDRVPDLIIGNKSVWGFGLKRIQTQQKMEFTPANKMAVWGATAFKFMNADFVIDPYAPSSSAEYGENNAKLGNWQTASSVTISGTPAAGSKLPSSGTFVPAEVMAMLNTQTWKFRISSHPYFQWGFTGYMPYQNLTKIVGRIHVMGTFYTNAPWLNVIGFGINS